MIWVNAGKAYPETLALVDEVRAEAAEFIEVCTDRAAQNAAWGIPSDLVPIDHTRIGQATTGLALDAPRRSAALGLNA